MFTESFEKEDSINWPDKTILIVEDNFHNYLYMQAVLERTDIKILYVSDGADAINTARQHQELDLILMDIRLPFVSGYEATRQIREFNPSIPIIAVTACSMSDEEEECKRAGCNAYLKKPVSQKELISVMSRYLIRESHYSVTPHY